MKEFMLWYVDDGGYYSSTTAKYLEYTTPPSLSSSLDSEESLLRAMFRLAHLTDRVLVLPEFHCHACAVTGLAGTKEACSGERPLCQGRGRAPMRVRMHLYKCGLASAKVSTHVVVVGWLWLRRQVGLGTATHALSLLTSESLTPTRSCGTGSECFGTRRSYPPAFTCPATRNRTTNPASAAVLRCRWQEWIPWPVPWQRCEVSAAALWCVSWTWRRR